MLSRDKDSSSWAQAARRRRLILILLACAVALLGLLLLTRGRYECVSIPLIGQAHCRFTAEDLAGVYLARWFDLHNARAAGEDEAKYLRAVPKTSWPEFVSALNTARRPWHAAGMTETVVLLVLRDGREVYLEGNGAAFWVFCRGARRLPPRKQITLTCPALGRVVAKVQKAAETESPATTDETTTSEDPAP